MGPARRSENDSYDRRTAEKLQDLGKRFRAVVQSATDAIVLVDARGEIRLWNAAAERMFGWSDAEALGRPFPTLFAERSRPDVEGRLGRRMGEPNERAESPFERPPSIATGTRSPSRRRSRASSAGAAASSARSSATCASGRKRRNSYAARSRGRRSPTG